MADLKFDKEIAIHWIGGEWLDSGEHRESINPATGEVIGSYAMGAARKPN